MAHTFSLSLSLLTSAALLGGCGTGAFQPDLHSDAGTGKGKTTSETPDGGGGGDATTLKLPDGGPGEGIACDGGVVKGTPAACCSLENVCGSSCCSGSSVCFFGTCVVPGASCHTASDCPKGEYCDPALAPPSDAGSHATPDAANGSVCSDPLPPLGRCAPSPPICPGDAGAPDGGACVASCQYMPPPGNLDAVVKWQWGPTATAFPDFTDVWSTPTVGRLYDTNCDGKVDDNDSPSIVFVAGNIGATECAGTANGCRKGVLRMLNGRTGQEIWSLDKASPSSMGFAGNSIALGDVDGDGVMDIVAITGEGNVVLLDGKGNVKRQSTSFVQYADAGSFAWGGGLALADLDNDGFPEILFGATVFSTKNDAMDLAWSGTGGTGGGVDALAVAVDLDGAANGHLEVLAGNTAYNADGSILWEDNGMNGTPKLPDGFSGVGDFNGDGKPEAVLVAQGSVWVLNGATGAIVLGPFALAGTGSGGPPTIADFDGDGHPDIGVAKATYYSVVKSDYDAGTLAPLWSMPSHDYSSSVTGSTVFDFSGRGKPSVVYGDECFLWVFDGPSGNVQYSRSHMSFTATEASLVADVDGDGHSEIVMISNGVSPVSWKCLGEDGVGATVNNATWQPGPAANQSYRGITVLGDSADSWVGTRTLWTEHGYHVTNVCDDVDQACPPPNVYGSIPKTETSNWTLPWLNNFRQNVQGAGVFNAPDPAVALAVDCSTPVIAHVDVRNIGQAGLPSGVNVAIFAKGASGDTQVGTTTTTIPLLPSQAESLDVTLSSGATTKDSLYAKIVIDPMHPTFHECNGSNNTSATVTPTCGAGPK